MIRPLFRAVCIWVLVSSLFSVAATAVAHWAGQRLPGGTLVVEVQSPTETLLYVIDELTRVRYRLTRPGVSAFDARWSPDGRYLAYQTWRNRETSLWLTTLDRPAQRVSPASQAYLSNLVWSPDSATLWFMQATGSRQEVVTVTLANTVVLQTRPLTLDDPAVLAYFRQLETALAGQYRAPDESGRSLSLEPDPTEPGWALRLHDRAGTHTLAHVRDIVAVSLLTPRWSPDGERIAYFDRAPDGGYEVWVIAAQPGARPRRLGDGLHPVWRPGR